MNTLSVFTALGAPNADQSMFGDLASEVDKVMQANCEYKTIVPEK